MKPGSGFSISGEAVQKPGERRHLLRNSGAGCPGDSAKLSNTADGGTTVPPSYYCQIRLGAYGFGKYEIAFFVNAYNNGALDGVALCVEFHGTGDTCKFLD